MAPIHIDFSSESKMYADMLGKIRDAENKPVQPLPKKDGEEEEKAPVVDVVAFKSGIVQAEVSGTWNYGALNPESTATGAYQILYSQAKKWLPTSGYASITSRQGFANSREAQEAYMNERIDTYVNKDSVDIIKRYKPQLGEKWNYSASDIAALSHFLGRWGTMEYLAAIRDGRDPASVLPPHAKNLHPEEYLRRFREGYEKRSQPPQ